MNKSIKNMMQIDINILRLKYLNRMKIIDANKKLKINAAIFPLLCEKYKTAVNNKIGKIYIIFFCSNKFFEDNNRKIDEKKPI